jgi:hypothetical protein
MGAGVRVRHRVRQRVVGGEQVAPARKPVCAASGMLGQPGIVSRDPLDRGLDAPRPVRRPAAGEADAYPQAARAGTLDASPRGDHADVDVVGPGDPAKGRVAGAGVDLLLQAGQGLEDRRQVPHRVDGAVRRLGVRGDPLDLYLGPQHAHAAEQQAETGRLEQDGRVAEHARMACGQRPVAGALLLDHGQEAQLPREGVRHGAAQRRHGEQAHREAALHVARAAARHPAAGSDRGERVIPPHRRLGRHHVHVAVQQE